MSLRSHAEAKRWMIVLGALALLALACAVPYHMNGMSTAGASPYWACATPTPEPPGWVEITPEPQGTPFWVTAEPPATATPFYRIGEFYLGQSATISSVQVRLVSSSVFNGYTLATFEVINHGEAETAVPLSGMIFGVDADGVRQVYNAEGQRAAGLPDPVTVETTPIAPGVTFAETLAIAGEHARIGLLTNLFTLGGSGAQPVWFRTAGDPVACPHGEAAWPVPAPRPAGYSYTGALMPAQPDVVGGEVPVQNWVRISTPFGCNIWNGLGSPLCPSDAPWFHAGIDLSAYQGEPIYTPIPGTVYFAGWSTVGYGNLVIVRTDLGGGDYLFMYFAHMMAGPLVAAGDTVRCGQNLGFVGSTGQSTGPHLHWETRRGSDPENSTAATVLSPEDTRVFWPRLCAEAAGQ